MSSSNKTKFTPVPFKDFGKSVRDLFKKKYDPEHKFKAVVKNSAGMAFEFGAILDQTQNVRGYWKETLTRPKFTVEAELNTDPVADSKATIKSSKLLENLTLEARINTKADDKKTVGPVYSAEANYGIEYVTGTAEFRTNRSQHRVRGGVSVGFDGVSIGAEVKADVTKAATIEDYNVGLEYARPSYIASLWTEQKADFANLGYWHRIGTDHTLGAVFRLELANQHSHSLTVGHEFLLDPKTNVRGKVEIPTGQIGLALEHRLQNPNLLFNLSTSFNGKALKKGLKADSFGFGITFGDN